MAAILSAGLKNRDLELGKIDVLMTLGAGALTFFEERFRYSCFVY